MEPPSEKRTKVAGNDDDDDDTNSSVKCANHKNERAVFFCETCKGPRCHHCCCSEEFCKGHRFSDIERGREVMAEAVEAHTAQLEDLLKKTRQDEEGLLREIELLDQQRIATQEDIAAFSSKVREIVGFIENSLMHELEGQCTETDSKLQAQIYKTRVFLEKLFAMRTDYKAKCPRKDTDGDRLTECYASCEEAIESADAEYEALHKENGPLLSLRKTFALTLTNEARSIVPASLVKLTTQTQYAAIEAPRSVSAAEVSGTWATLKWSLPPFVGEKTLTYEVGLRVAGDPEFTLTEAHTKGLQCRLTGLDPDTVYQVRVCGTQGCGANTIQGAWSAPVELRTQPTVHYEGFWKGGSGYRVSGKNSSVVIKGSDMNKWAVTAVGSEPLTPGIINRWTIVLQDSELGHYGIAIGVAPASIDQTRSNNHKSCGWYYTGWSTLYSGPPDCNVNVSFGENVDMHDGTEITLEMDMTKGTLTYIVDGKWIGVAYTAIPTKRPLVPAVVFGSSYYSIKLK